MADRRLHESGGPDGGTRGGYIDSFENMPGAQNQPFGAKPTKAFVPEIGDRVSVELHEPVSGLVCDRLPGPFAEAAIVVRLDDALRTATPAGRPVHGRWLVLEPGTASVRWRRRATASVELWTAAPSTEPWLEPETGALLLSDANYRFGD